MKILVAILVLFFSYNATFAHSCATFSGLSDKKHSENLQKVDKIFYGEIISIIEDNYRNYLIKFKVIRAWKGIKLSEITAKFSNPCGIVLSVGEKRLVYGYSLNDKNVIDVNCCNFGLFDDERMKREYGEGKIIEDVEPKFEIKEAESFFSWLWRKITSIFS